MNKLELQLDIIKVKCNLLDWQVDIVASAMRSHTIGALNSAQILISKKADPITMRALIEEHGVTYDGNKKQFK